MKKTKEAATALTTVPAEQPCIDYLNNLYDGMNEINAVTDTIDDAVSTLYNHFFDDFEHECRGINELMGLPDLTAYLSTFGKMVHLATDSIHRANEHLKTIYDNMWCAYKAERERIKAAESAANKENEQ